MIFISVCGMMWSVGMKLTYREATKDDSQELFNLSYKFTEFNVENSGAYKEFFPKGWRKDFMEEIMEQLENKEHDAIFVAIDEQKIVGYIHAYYCDKCYHAIINELFILKEYRGNKIGEELMKMAEKFCKKFKAPLRVEVYTWNDKAIEFYLKNNYRKTTVVLEKIK